MRKNDFNKVAMWNHTFALLISCKSSVYLQNIFFEEHLWGRTFENIYCSGQSKSALWKPCGSEDDAIFIKQGNKILEFSTVIWKGEFSLPNTWFQQ